MAHHVTEIVLRSSIRSYEEQNGNSVNLSDINIVGNKCEPGSSIGDNFLGEIFRVHVEYSLGTHKSDKVMKKVPFIVKILDHTLPNGPFLVEMDVYSKESFCYRTVLPKLHVIAKGESFGPKCYYFQEEPVRLIVMEDLRESGFFMADRRIGVNFEQCAMTFKKIASFHAASMILAEQSPEIMKKFSRGMSTFPLLVDGFYKGFLNELVEILTSWAVQDEDFKRILPKIKHYRDNHRATYNMPLRTGGGDTYQLLNHGDLWVNNIMFKYGDDNGNKHPIDIRFIDYQISIYTSPGYDLNYFLMMSPDREVRFNREGDLLEIYRLEFNNKLKEYNYPKSFMLTREMLQKAMMEKALYGFNMMLTTLPAILRDASATAEHSGAVFLNDQERQRAQREMMRNPQFLEYLQFYLKKFEGMGVLDLQLSEGDCC